MDLSKQLASLATALNVRFSFNGRPVSHQDVFSRTGLLPGLVKQADQLCSLCLGYGLGVSFDDAENALLGVEVKFDEVTPNSLRLFCLLDALMELIKASPSRDLVVLDELMYY